MVSVVDSTPTGGNFIFWLNFFKTLNVNSCLTFQFDLIMKNLSYNVAIGFCQISYFLLTFESKFFSAQEHAIMQFVLDKLKI